MATFFLKEKQIRKQWVIIDVEEVVGEEGIKKRAVVGRLASFVTKLLRGKHKPEYTPHMDCGDNVIIVNAEKVFFTGKKLKDKIYYRHTGYVDGLKSSVAGNILTGKFPERILKMAVKRMLGTGPMARRHLENLHIYAGPDHKHQGQQPKKINFISLNYKNGK
ncbi:50S ribosomal protein L13 [Wolbachia endosymbiont of Pentidionis agamae]|uniref:50S ribosomal protein L13 n=1 Tax=Wolbachia endosymbiont of Pentidionis agamae TaxID=3110435 RepID=UPI002FD2A8CD